MQRFRWLLVLSLVAATATGARAQAPALESLGFMSGCWQSSADARGTVLEETWTEPSTNLMLAMTRYLRAGSAVMFEFSRIERSDSAVVLTPYPRGNASVGFRLTGPVKDEAVFENPSHDFPQRIRYRKDGAALVVRIERLSGEGQEWRVEGCS